MTPGIINPGTRKISINMKQIPSKKTTISSWPAKPATYFDPKKTSNKTIPETPKIPNPGVLNSTKIHTKPMLKISGAMPLSQSPLSRPNLDSFQ